jgi:hypothetical protein
LRARRLLSPSARRNRGPFRGRLPRERHARFRRGSGESPASPSCRAGPRSSAPFPLGQGPVSGPGGAGRRSCRR